VGCTGQCQDTPTRLTAADVQTVIAQAVAEAQGNSLPATIAVVDRVGNVLAVYRMTGARSTVVVTSNRGVTGGLEDAAVPSELAAVSKAVTGAFLSSEGNAFSTRIASQIVQEHFNPGEFGGPSGPLSGVQFSQLLCSDFIQPPGPALAALGVTGNLGIGPKTAPLGLSADPGGFPLYKNGTVVGGVGIAADPNYSLDPVTSDRDRNLDELIAWAATFGFSAPAERRGDRITVDGKIFQFTNTEFEDLSRPAGQAPAFSGLGTAAGSLIVVPGFNNGQIVEGTAFGQPESGIRPDTRDYTGLDAFVLVDSNNAERYRPRPGTEASGALTQLEVQTLLQEGLKVANRARAQIRSPFNSQARVTLSVVDTNGEVLGVVRTRDAPIFGADVSLQKARTAAFFSSASAAAELTALPDAVYANGAVVRFVDYVSATRSFFGMADFLTGKFAITPRAIGNISRPFYPDGIRGTANGPLSKPFSQWSPFSDGLQLDLVNNIVLGILGAYGQALPAPGSTAPTAEQVTNLLSGVVAVRTAGCTTNPKLRNGIQIFPGASPVYRGNVLVGALGISGDGIDQDDMISFLGTANASAKLGGSIGHAPANIRIDQTVPGGARLRYVQCPQAPFLDSNEQNVCEGK
jgi:uncharacterized protein GlcG (DUF336 family)